MRLSPSVLLSPSFSLSLRDAKRDSRSGRLSASTAPRRCRAPRMPMSKCDAEADARNAERELSETFPNPIEARSGVRVQLASFRSGYGSVVTRRSSSNERTSPSLCVHAPVSTHDRRKIAMTSYA